MRADGFPARLFGRDPRALPLPRPVPVLRAVLRDPRRIRCGTLFLDHPQPILALCRALRERGGPDCAVQVHWLDRSPAGFVPSFHALADFTESSAR